VWNRPVMMRGAIRRFAVLRFLLAAALCTALFLPLSAYADSPQALFYYVPTEDGWESLSQHIGKISILAPQVFIVDETGQVHGEVEERVRALAKQHGVELMPLLANVKPEAAHAILSDENRRHQVIADALRLCQASGCAGLQLDIEDVLPADGPAFAAFAREAAEAFHAQHLRLSVAVPSPLFSASLPKEKYTATFGGFGVDARPYPLDQIVPHVDFVTLMAYGQYGQGTAPGPVAGISWVEQSVRYVLQRVPAPKLSLGVGLWAQHWCNQQVTNKRYVELEALNSEAWRKARWDKTQRAPFFEYEGQGCHAVVWYENRRSLKEKFKLVSRYRLLGFSAWRLGQEDPEIWKELRDRK
jgi:spore germination protein YaaH